MSKMYMIRMSTATKLLLPVLFLLCVCNPSFSQKLAKLSIKTVKIDMGTIYTDSAKRTYVVPFINKGKAPLKIKEARPDCTCTFVEYPREKIAPHQQGILQISVDMTGFLPGDVEKKVGIYSNSKKNPVVIYLKGKIVRKE